MTVFNKISYCIHSHVFSDISDRLCTTVTSLILLIAAIVVFLMQHVRFLFSPITCWTPAQFTGEWSAYTERYCYQSNTFYSPFIGIVPTDYGERRSRQLRKDQFVVLMLIIHALQFYFLRLLWTILSSNCFSNLTSILKVSSQVAKISEPVCRQSQMRSLAQFVRNSISKCGILLSVLYLIVKFLCMANIFLQIYSIQQFLEVEDFFWGFKMVSNMKNGLEWESVPVFPQVTMCDFEVRVKGNVHHHTVQCTMDISYFLTNIYLIIWYWMVFVAVISIFSLIYWIIITITSFLPPTRSLYIQRLLNAGYTGKTMLPYHIGRFVSRLSPDSLMVLHFVSSHTNELMATELAAEMYNNIENKNVGYAGPMAPADHVSETSELLGSTYTKL